MASLSSQQANALFDILTHHAVYDEIQRYKYPTAIDDYGPPFDIDQGKASKSPVLQTLLYRFVLTLPGLKEISKDFWQKRIEDLVREFGDAELSESYDKGTIGSRRTLATAIATLIEYPTRGVLGGIPKRKPKHEAEDYDLSDPEEVKDAFEDFLQEMVYGDLIDHLSHKIGQTDQLSEQTMRVQGTHEFILVNLASFLHYIMILSPDGPYLARVLENIHRLLPYGMMRSTLRVGNAATMISGMVKLFLTKMTVNSVTSWIGLTSYSDSGMNLLQQIASTVIGWDISELNKQTYKAEKAKEAPPKEHLEAIKKHMKKPRDVRDRRRETSEKKSISIVQAILDDEGVKTPLNAEQHAKAMDFLSIQLSIRDREQLSHILCSLNPDIMTQAIRDLVAAYDPLIRQCHNAIDLSGTLFDYENFLTDFIRLSKGHGGGEISRPSTPRLVPSRPGTPKPGQSRKSSEHSLPTVEDYVALLRKHQSAVHRFLHQAVKNDKQLAEKWINYAKDAVAQFRRTDTSEEKGGGAGDLTPSLQDIFSKLPEKQQKEVLDALDNYTAYTMALTASSQDKWTSLTSSDERKTSTGPGIYLAKWQQLLDSTSISPATPHGPVRTGKDKSVREKAGVGVENNHNREQGRGVDRIDAPDMPDIKGVVDALGPGFREILQREGRQCWEQGGR